MMLRFKQLLLMTAALAVVLTLAFYSGGQTVAEQNVNANPYKVNPKHHARVKKPLSPHAVEVAASCNPIPVLSYMPLRAICRGCGAAPGR